MKKMNMDKAMFAAGVSALAIFAGSLQVFAADTAAQDNAEKTSVHAGMFVASGENLYYVENGNLCAVSATEGAQTQVLRAATDEESVDEMLLADEDELYYVVNSKESNSLVKYDTESGNEEEVVSCENFSVSYDGSVYTDMEIMGKYSDKLIYRTGSSFDYYTAHVFDTSSGKDVDMMENVGKFIGAWNDYCVFWAGRSDVSPVKLIVYDAYGNSVWETYAIRTPYLDEETGLLYTRDDTEFGLLNETGTAEDSATLSAEERLEKIDEIHANPAKVIVYSISDDTQEDIFVDEAASAAYMGIGFDENGLVFVSKTDGEGTVRVCRPADDEDAQWVELSDEAQVFAVNGNVYALDGSTILKLDFETGTSEDIAEMEFASEEHSIYWCEIPGSEDLGCLELSYTYGENGTKTCCAKTYIISVTP